MKPKDPLGTSEDPVPLEAPGPPRPQGARAAAMGSPPAAPSRPLLMVDIDGVISLFAGAGSPRERRPEEGSWHSIEGMVHFLSANAAAHLLALAGEFELVWASGWEERADEHLPHLLGLPSGLPFLRFERAVGRANAHWKLDAIDSYAAGRALAWVDDALGPECEAWAQRRPSPTLLVQTDPEVGLTEVQTRTLADWAASLRAVG